MLGSDECASSARENGAMDPHAVLGLTPDATLDQATEAYKRLAKRWHPDVMGVEGLARMTELNVAYELLRAEHRPRPPGASVGPRAKVTAMPDDHRGGARHGAWLPEAVRRALGPELLSALEPGEPVAIVTPAATWASPSTLLAVTDRRLLWVLDDAVSNRVRFMRFRDVERAEQGRMWPRRSRAQLRVQPRYGHRRWTFSDLRPATADAIAGLVRAGASP
jgi:hypothetical protein